MSAALTFAPSKSALRLLKHLALAGSTIGAFGGIVSVHQAIYRQTQCLERVLEQKRLLSSLSNQNSAAHLNRLFQAAEAGQHTGLKSSRNTNIRKASLDADTAQQSDEQAQKLDALPGKHRSWHLRKPFSPGVTAAQRIIDSTLQQHKSPSHTVYGRPKNQSSESQDALSTSVRKHRINNSIAQASLLPHKSPLHQVHWRPKGQEKGSSPTLATCVNMWLRPESQAVPSGTLDSSTRSSASAGYSSPTLGETPRRPCSDMQNSRNKGSLTIKDTGLRPSSRHIATLSRPVSVAHGKISVLPITGIWSMRLNITQGKKREMHHLPIRRHRLSIKITRSGSTLIYLERFNPGRNSLNSLGVD